jgi:thiosulfate/3-mercaptopyruvate sulfurtransferase
VITNKSPLIDATELLARIDEADLVVCDCRWYLEGGGRGAYDRGHIPGAFFVDLEHELASPPAPTRAGRHPLPSREAFAHLLSRLGVTTVATVVAYDDRGGAIAARLWWLLRYYGLDVGRVLDGGLDAWIAAGGRLDTTPEPRGRAATFVPVRPKAAMVVDADEVAQLHGREGALVIDARARERYEGANEPVDRRAGHVPGAVNAPYTENLDGGRMKTPEELARRYGAIGALQAKELVAYCGSGITACHDLLALAVLGRTDAKLYEGSWSDWSNDPDRPITTGRDP